MINFAALHELSGFKIQDNVSICINAIYMSHLPQVGYHHTYSNLDLT
jgi:hypothetical protein